MKVKVESEYLKSERQRDALLQLVFILAEITEVLQSSIQLPTRGWVEGGWGVVGRESDEMQHPPAAPRPSPSQQVPGTMATAGISIVRNGNRQPQAGLLRRPIAAGTAPAPHRHRETPGGGGGERGVLPRKGGTLVAGRAGIKACTEEQKAQGLRQAAGGPRTRTHSPTPARVCVWPLPPSLLGMCRRPPPPFPAGAWSHLPSHALRRRRKKGAEGRHTPARRWPLAAGNSGEGHGRRGGGSPVRGGRRRQSLRAVNLAPGRETHLQTGSPSPPCTFGSQRQYPSESSLVLNTSP